MTEICRQMPYAFALRKSVVAFAEEEIEEEIYKEEVKEKSAERN